MFTSLKSSYGYLSPYLIKSISNLVFKMLYWNPMAFNAEKILVAHQYFIEDGSQIKVQNKNDEGDCFSFWEILFVAKFLC